MKNNQNSAPTTGSGTSIRSQVAWGFVIAAFASQLAASYYDVVRGPLMPAVAKALNLEFAKQGGFLAAGFAASSVANFLMIWALHRWSIRRLLLWVLSMGLVAGCMARYITTYIPLLVLGALLGIAVSTLGTIANVLIVEGSPVQWRARMMSGVHSIYGLGSLLGSAVVGVALERGVRWYGPYEYAIPVYLGLMIFGALRLGRKDSRQDDQPTQSLGLRPMQCVVILIFSLYTAAEVTTQMWMSTFLADIDHLSVSASTNCLTAFFLVMIVTRLACALFLEQKWETPAIIASLVLTIIAFIFGYTGQIWGFAMMGVCGPFFPLFLARMSRTFPNKWRTTMVWAIVGMNLSVSISGLILGRVADVFGLARAYLLAPMLWTAVLVCLAAYLTVENPAVLRRTRAQAIGSPFLPSLPVILAWPRWPVNRLSHGLFDRYIRIGRKYSSGLKRPRGLRWQRRERRPHSSLDGDANS